MTGGIFFLLLSLLLTGCSSLVFPKASPPVYYKLDSKPAPLQCPQTLGKGIRIWEFGTASPYDRREMVVIENGHKISFSHDFQWVAAPGVMVSEILFKYFNGSGPFTKVMTANDPVQVPLDMTGRVLAFSWEREGGTSGADLELEVSVTDHTAVDDIYFHKRYLLKSDRISGEGSSEDFSRAMSGLVAEASATLKGDLCRFAENLRAQGKGP